LKLSKKFFWTPFLLKCGDAITTLIGINTNRVIQIDGVTYTRYIFEKNSSQMAWLLFSPPIAVIISLIATVIPFVIFGYCIKRMYKVSAGKSYKKYIKLFYIPYLISIGEIFFVVMQNIYCIIWVLYL